MQDTLYPWPLRLTHWLTVGLVIVQVGLAITNWLVYEPRPILAEALVQAHLSLGALAFAITLARLGLRLWLGRPAFPDVMRSATRHAARVVHALLYVLLLALPITGYIKLAALGFEITLFGIIALPALPFDPELATRARLAHRALAILLGLAVVGHALAAIFHARLFGGVVLYRMGVGTPRP
ncbi:MAG: cytochrome b/b6 domain-containing protein [Pseudomonadota bacterium]